MSVEDVSASTERSIVSASKNKMYGVLPKTLLNLCKSIRANLPSKENLIEVTIQAISGLDDESLIKVGPDLANLCSLALDNHQADIYTSLIRPILNRIGRLDNDIVTLCLRNPESICIGSPKLLKELIFDLVKFYFKSQSDNVAKILTLMLESAVSGPIEPYRAISETIIELHRDNSVEESSLGKFMSLCASLKLQEREVGDQNRNQRLNTKEKFMYACEKARLLTWFSSGGNKAPGAEKPSLTMLRMMAETEFVQKGVLRGPFGSDVTFTVPSLNVFIQQAK